MAIWLVRAGSRGESEDFALEKNIALIGWGDLGDLSGIKTREELFGRLQATYPNAKPNTLKNWESQIWAFIKRIKPGDLVALPLKQRPAVAFGKVVGDYRYRPDFPPGARHTRPVEWIKEVPRSAIDQDLLYSLGAFMTVCRIQRNNAEKRLRALLDGKASPMPAAEVPGKEAASDEGAEANLEEIALDQIQRFISQRFKGHRLTDLVAAVLTAQGFKVRIAPEGPDGGVDILAGSGELGFDEPRIAVQVKSGDAPADIKAVRELQGAMKNFGASQGLFVSWGGFKSSVSKEVARLFFEIRLWGPEELMREVLRHYDALPDELQAELPLKRIWVLVPPAEEQTP
ncbi:MAG: restriction endonuclease [Zetaproteobacteria bacterium]|nr:MAG: restriction endonuclease [Zetaproteobacteria bacterium]